MNLMNRRRSAPSRMTSPPSLPLLVLLLIVVLLITLECTVAFSVWPSKSTRHKINRGSPRIGKALHGAIPMSSRISLSASSDNPASSSSPSLYSSSISVDSIEGKKVLVVGGSGRVGGSVVTQLVKRGAIVTVGGTSETNFVESQSRWPTLFPSFATELNAVSFEGLDRESVSSVQPVLERNGFDLVVHTAGPFQGKVGTPNGVLEACVETGTPYIDVCDDYCTAMAAKTKYSAKAIENNKAPCIVSTGCWVSFVRLLMGVVVVVAKKAINTDTVVVTAIKQRDAANMLMQQARTSAYTQTVSFVFACDHNVDTHSNISPTYCFSPPLILCSRVFHR